jgi:Protein of unknown function (DUF2795)
VDRQRAAEIQVALEGVKLPASRDELIRYMQTQEPSLVAELQALLPKRTYEALDDVGEALAPVQPAQYTEERLPKAESGEPPGGGDYVNRSPRSGGVRDDAPPDNPPQRVLEQQTSLQKKQQQRQGG